jgi:3-oxoacyl-[acyl-carrier protein] reductase
MALSLQGRTALITGASRGLGLAIARRFLQAGASAIITARRPDVLQAAKNELEEVAPGRVAAHACDVADREQLAALCATLSAEGREIDVLVNNAGGSIRGLFEAIDDDSWQRDIEVKLFAAIRLTRFVLPGMKARRWGRILNVVSVNGKAPPAGGAPTAVTRAAGIALTKVFASEFAPHNVLVNALCAGVFRTDSNERSHKSRGGNLSLAQFLEKEAKPVPLGRLGVAEEFANVALLLASEAGSYVTGAAINIDGGLSKVV